MIFKISVQFCKDEITSTDLLIETPAQEKKITYPTVKLLTKVIELCNNIEKRKVFNRDRTTIEPSRNRRLNNGLLIIQKEKKEQKQHLEHF